MYLDIYNNIMGSNNYEKLSQGQQQIHQFILKNIDNISEITTTEIADACFVSTTTVNRYSKTMGADGFSMLKHAIIINRGQREEYDSSLILSHLSQAVSNIYIDDLEKIKLVLKNNKVIYIFGTGTSYIMAKYLQRLLNRLGITAIATNEYSYLNLLEQIEVCIIISNTGETHSAILAAKHVSSYGEVISITKKGSNLDKYSHYRVLHDNSVQVNNSIENEMNVGVYLAIINLVHAISFNNL